MNSRGWWFCPFLRQDRLGPWLRGLICLAITLGGILLFWLGMHFAHHLMPASLRLRFWQQALQQSMGEITQFRPGQNGGPAALVWTEQWTAQVADLAPWSLVYRPPAGQDFGVLILYQRLAPPAGSAGREKPHQKVLLKKVQSFTWHLKGVPVAANVLQAPFQLELAVQLAGMKRPQVLLINLPNLAGPRGLDGRLVRANQDQRWQSRMAQTALAGGHVFSNAIWEQLWKNGQNNAEEAEEVSSEDHLVLCQRVDDQCQIIGQATCDRCRYGFFPVVGPRYCPHTGNYACGPNRCGQANWPACWRGFEASAATLQDQCYDGSTTGYCHEGLQTMCRDQILYCW